MPKSQDLLVEGRPVAISNPDKVLFPGGRTTKAQVIDYYIRVAAGYYKDDKLIFVAKIKNGFVPRLRQQIAAAFKGLETTICPFANLPEPRNARRGEAITQEVMDKLRWLKPQVVAQIEFTEWTTNDLLRHSRFVALRDDKPAREVTREVA